MARRRQTLEMLLDTILESIPEAPAYSRAPLVREARGILAELDELSEGEEKPSNVFSDFQARLAERQSGSAGSRRKAEG